MLRMCVYIHSRFVENHPIRILEDGPLISEGVLSQKRRAHLSPFVDVGRGGGRTAQGGSFWPHSSRRVLAALDQAAAS
jgi:hypothetical protein